MRYAPNSATRYAIALIAALAESAGATDAKPTAGIRNDAPQPLYGSPIEIESCLITPSLSPTVGNVASAGGGYLGGRIGGWGGAAIALGGAAVVSTVAENPKLLVRFVNEGGKTSDIVKVDIDNTAVSIRYTGLIGPGDDTTQRFSEGKAFAGYGGERAIGCHIAFVHFTDGTTWSAPQYRRQAR